MEFVACDLCESNQANTAFQLPDFSFGETGEEFSVVRCERCQLLYLNPRPTESEISKYYPESYFPTRTAEIGKEQGPGQSRKKVLSKPKRWLLEDYYGYPSQESSSIWRIIRKVILFPDWAQRSLRGKDVIPYCGAGRILDVGCGPGVNLESLERFGWDVYGLDFNDVAIAEARRKFGDRIYSGTLEDVSLEDESFDVILFSHSLEHMFSPAKALVRARQLLKPQGMVVVTLPNANSVEARLFGRWWFPWEIPRHLYHFDRTTLAYAMKKAGMDPVRVRTGKGSLFFMTSLQRYCSAKWNRNLPGKKLIERLIVRPLTLTLGHLGHGNEITMYAVRS